MVAVAQQISSLITIEISHKHILLIPLAPSFFNPLRGRVALTSETAIFVVQRNMYVTRLRMTNHVVVAVFIDVTGGYKDDVTRPFAKAAALLDCCFHWRILVAPAT
jgi:hypothetical protein